MTGRRVQLAVKAHREGDGTVVHLDGELDLATCDVLRSALDRIAGTRLGSRVVLDLGDLSFVDVAGLHALLETSDRLRAPVVVRRPSRAVQRVLSLLRLEGELPLERA